MFMTILHVGQKGMPVVWGGVERHVHDIAVRQVQQGHEVVVTARSWYTPRATTGYKGVRVRHLPSIPTKNLDAISHTLISLLYAVFVLRPDVVHIHGVGPSLLTWIPRLFLPRATVIVTFHSIDRTQEKWGWIGRLALWLGEWTALHLPHETIIISKSLQRYARKKDPSSTTVYIPNGVQEMPGIEPTIISETFGLTRGSYILSVARLIPCKGLDFLIQAYQELAPSEKLVIVGDNAQDRSYVQRLRNMADSNPNILFLGVQWGPALSELYANAAVFVQASTTEGMSLALLEALASGLPVVASDIPANREALETLPGKQLGLLFPSESVDGLKDVLREVLANRSVHASNVLQHKDEILKIFSWDRITRETLDLYRAVRAQKILSRMSSRSALSSS